MLSDLAQLFTFSNKENEDKIIIDNYRLDSGLYLRVDQDWNIAAKLTVDRKKEDSSFGSNYEWFRGRDYYSQLVDMNKPVDPKKIVHSNNYLTLFIKKDVYPEIGSPDKVLSVKEFQKAIKRYFEVLKKSPRERYNDKMTIEMIESLNLQEIPKEELLKNETFFEQRFEVLQEIIASEKFEKYIKIFFDAVLDVYQREYYRYTIPKIYNRNEFNIIYRGQVYGLSNNNMGMNTDKPYLELKTTRFKVPYRISIEEALVNKRTFDWLGAQKENIVQKNYGHTQKTFESPSKEGSHYYIYITKKKGTIVEDYDNVPIVEGTFKFKYVNYLMIKDESGKLEIADEVFSSKKRLEEEFDKLYFNYRLKRNYYSDPKNIKVKTNEFSGEMLNLLLTSRVAMRDYFLKDIDKGIEEDFIRLIQRITIELVKEQVRLTQGHFVKKAGKALNLRYSLLEHFKRGGVEMGDRIRNIVQSLNERTLSKELFTCENDEEFYFLTGQLAYFIIYQNETSKKNYGLFEPFLRVGTGQQLKTQLTNVFKSYEHALQMDDIDFKNVFGAVMGYLPEKNLKDCEDLFLAGIMADNIFFRKQAK